jgi:RNase P/RNase MRP subunit POP5
MTPWLDGAGPVIEPPRIALRAAGDSELPIQAQHRAAVPTLLCFRYPASRGNAARTGAAFGSGNSTSSCERVISCEAAASVESILRCARSSRDVAAIALGSHAARSRLSHTGLRVLDAQTSGVIRTDIASFARCSQSRALRSNLDRIWARRPRVARATSMIW